MKGLCATSCETVYKQSVLTHALAPIPNGATGEDPELRGQETRCYTLRSKERAFGLAQLGAPNQVTEYRLWQIRSWTNAAASLHLPGSRRFPAFGTLPRGRKHAAFGVRLRGRAARQGNELPPIRKSRRRQSQTIEQIASNPSKIIQMKTSAAGNGGRAIPGFESRAPSGPSSAAGPRPPRDK